MMKLEGFKGKKICVAISGGADSVCLLHKLQAERDKIGYSLCAVHCEHGIRGEDSEKDCLFVKELCRKQEVPLLVFKEDCPRLANDLKVSLETAARMFRRRSFSEALAYFSADYIATAHHVDDEAETVLFRLARGSSLSGAAAMREQDGRIVRPLLNESKKEILRYVKTRGLSWREDATNAQTDAVRNRLRLNVMPQLEAAVSGASGNLARFARIAAEDDEYLYRLSSAFVYETKKETLSDTGIRVAFCQEKPLFRRACLTALKKAGIERDYTLAQLERIYALQSLQTGKKVTVLAGVQAVKTYDSIAFYKNIEAEERAEWEAVISLSPPQGSEWGRVLRADADSIPESAVIRTFQEGDEFKKFGGGTKKLKKYFIDEKISCQKRKHIPLLAEKNAPKVYAVCGVEISEEIKVTENTKRTVYIYLQKKKQGE